MHHPTLVYKTFSASEDIIGTKSEDVDTQITIINNFSIKSRVNNRVCTHCNHAGIGKHKICVWKEMYVVINFNT